MRKLTNFFILVLVSLVLSASGQQVPGSISKLNQKSVKLLGAGERTAVGPQLFSQMSDPNLKYFLTSIELSDAPQKNSFAADDFTVPTGETWEIGTVKVQSIGMNYDGIEGFNLVFYNDNQGKPGTEALNVNVKEGFSIEQWNYEGYMYAEVTAHLGESLSLSEGVYWLSVSATGTSTLNTWGYLFQNTKIQEGNSWHWKNPSNDSGSGFIDWTKGQTVATGFFMQFYPNLCFSLHKPLLNNDLAIQNIDWPESGEALTASESIDIELLNNGVKEQSGFQVRYRVDGGTWVSETVNSTISAGATFKYSFHAMADLSKVKGYNLEVEVVLAQDENFTNNSLSRTVYNYGKIHIAQDNSKITVCEGTFTDEGGLTSGYTMDMKSFSIVPGIKGKIIKITFPEFDLGGDKLLIYNGEGAGSELIGEYSGNALLNKTVYGYNDKGSLTFSLDYAAFEPGTGWAGFIQCIDPVENDFSVESVRTGSFNLFQNEAVKLIAKVRNQGSKTQSKEVVFKINENAIGTVLSPELKMGETAFVELLWVPASMGQTAISASVADDNGYEDDNVSQYVAEVYAQGRLVESFENEKFPPLRWAQSRFGGFYRSNFTDYKIPSDGDWVACIAVYGAEPKDTLFTPLLDIKAGDKLSYYAYSEPQVGGGLRILYSASKKGPWKFLSEDNLFDGNEKVELSLDACVGKNYIAFAGVGLVVLDEIKGPQQYFADKDIMIYDLLGNEFPSLYANENYIVSLKNIGNKDLASNDYTIELYERSTTGDILLETVQGVALAAFAETNIQFSTQFSKIGATSIYAKVVLSGDFDLSNNATSVLNLIVLKEGSENALVGTQKNTSYLYPFAPGYTAKAGEVLYKSSEIKKAGELNGLTLSYSNNSFIKGTLEVFVLETSDNTLPETFTSAENFYKVFDGTVEFNKGNNLYLHIPFNTPYLYGGKNLRVIYYWHYSNYYGEVVFNVSNTSDIRINAISNNFTNKPLYIFDQEYLDGEWTNRERLIPNTIFHIVTKDCNALLSGTITNTDKQPLEGVKVMVEGYMNEVFTNNEGKYQIESMPYGEQKILATLFGYFDNEQSAQFGQVSETIVDFTMERLANVAITGRVVTNDYNTPLVGAKVQITGYQNIETLSDAEGNFRFDDVFVLQNYTLNVKHFSIEDFTQEISTSIDTLKLGDVVVDEKETPAYNFKALLADNKVELKWNLPYGDKSITLAPSDTTNSPSDNYLANEPDENVQVGNLFELTDTATLTSITFKVIGNNYLEENGNVSIKIYDRNRVLVGESEPFMMPNTPQWLTIKLPNITFDGEFYAMMHWNKLPKTTPFLGFTYTNNNVAYIITEADGWKKLSDLIPVYTGAVRMSANLIKGKDGQERTIENYAVYRAPMGASPAEFNWTLLNDKVTGNSYTDENYSSLDSGFYMYRLNVNYTKSVSAPVYSNTVSKGVFANLKFVVNTNNGVSSKGAVVTLTNKKGTDIYNYKATVGEDGTVTLPEVYKIAYKLIVALNGFESYNADINVLGDKQLIINLNESILAPANLQAVVNQQLKTIDLTWGIGTEKTLKLDNGTIEGGLTIDNGDGYMGNLFETNTMGYIASIDVYGVQHNELTYEQTAAVTLEIFDANWNLLSATEEFKLPSNKWLTVDLKNLPYKGTFFAMVHMQNGTTNYLAIESSNEKGHYYSEATGLITIGEASGKDGVFLIRANVLVTGTADQKSPVITTKRVETQPLVNVVSIQESYVASPVQSGPTFNVYLDDMSTPIASGITERNYTITESFPAPGQHVAGVSAVYSTGESVIAKVAIIIGALESCSVLNITMYPNPARNYIQLQGVSSGLVTIYSVSGKLVATYAMESENQFIDVSHLESGSYILRVTSNNATGEHYLQIQK